ncbi:MAG: PAS domain-containing protein [Armatimonadetes bacterium]|nr:PAS domain-containing protein [Armatimonadota bacterium]
MQSLTTEPAYSDEPPRLVTIAADPVFEAVIGIESDGRIASVNPAACELFGVTTYPPPPGTLLGLTLWEATHVRALSDLLEAALTAQESRDTEVRLVGARERQVRARVTPVRASLGGGAILALVDQTEILRLRTVRTDFVANVSHELRTPLASIRAMAETLLDGALNDAEAAPRFLQTIIREADRLVSLSTDLLELSKAESQEPDAIRFDLSQLLSDVGARVAANAERRGIHLTVQPTRLTIPVPVEADRSQLDQVLFNLVDNAIKYTPRGGSVLADVQVRTGDAGKPEAVVTVADTGIGIMSQDLPRIWERFWRADRARRFQSGEGNTAANGGTGLGLSIVKHIVEAHLGTVSVESELGQGTRFTVTLPLRESAFPVP